MHRHTSTPHAPPCLEIIITMDQQSNSTSSATDAASDMSLELSPLGRSVSALAHIEACPIPIFDDDDVNDDVRSCNNNSKPLTPAATTFNRRDSIPKCPQRNSRARFDCPQMPDVSPQLPRRSPLSDDKQRAKSVSMPSLPLPASAISLASSTQTKDMPPCIPLRKWSKRNATWDQAQNKVNSTATSKAAFTAPQRTSSLTLTDVFATLAASRSAAPIKRDTTLCNPSTHSKTESSIDSMDMDPLSILDDVLDLLYDNNTAEPGVTTQ